MALNLSRLTLPINRQIIDPSTGVMREDWALYFDKLTGQLNGAVGELGNDLAPAAAEFIVGATSADLSAERVATNSTSNTWNLSVAGQAAVERAALTGDVTAAANSNALAIADEAVTNAKLANMTQGSIKGRATGAGTGDPTDLTGTQATAVLDVFTSALKGLVPASGGAADEFLCADATFKVPGGGAVVPLAAGALSAVATLDLTSIPADADMIEIDLMSWRPATDNVGLHMRFSQSGSFLTGASDYQWASSTADFTTPDAADPQIVMTTGWGNATAEAGSLTVRIFRPLAAGFIKQAVWAGGRQTTATVLSLVQGIGQLRLNSDAIDGVRFYFSSGNIASGYYAARYYKFT